MSKNNTVFIGKNKSFWDRNRRSEGYLLQRRTKQICISIVRALLMFGLCFMIIQPMLIRFSTAFMEEKDLYDSTIVLVPRHLTTENFQHVFNLTGFPTSMVNTLWISLVVSVLQVISCTFVAYGFARFEFPLKKFWFACVVLLIIVPPTTIQTSLYMSFANFDIFGIFKALTGGPINLRTSMLPYALMSLTCMGLKNGLYIYMLRQYFKNVPDSLEEAARVDGCSTLRTFTQIMLPDAMPTIASCFLFSFVWQWTDLFYSRNFLSTYKLYSVELSSIVSRMSRYFSADASVAVVVPVGRQQQLISIGVLICCIPLIILYCFTQKTFVQSLAMTGSKE
ncbi:MAG: carbohydrate ABC transporter permease [Clostridia bacterium]|nr:carbohydrate ABC transporter permease [Clostridia bacterium]MBQ8620606.1 carbohydrate ABC transporter permease [Clostridia bacterium]